MKKSKTVSIILSTVMLLSSLAACSPDAQICEHVYKEITSVEATCQEAGLKISQCEKCSILNEEVVTGSHAYALGFCSVCGEADPSYTPVSKDDLPSEPTVINLECLKAGYGTSWLYKLVEKFEALYEDEGYRVNVIKPTSDMRNHVAIQQLARGYEATQVDVYITSGVTSEKVGSLGEYGVLCEEVSSLWNKNPIAFDGSTETRTLKEKVSSDMYGAYLDTTGKTYALPYIAAAGGMVVNTQKLALYGVTELPTTTDELFEVWDKIYRGANGKEGSEETLLFPFTYVPGSKNSYSLDWMAALLAQYDEKQSEEFWSWQTENADGTVTWWESDVSKAASSDAVKEMLEVLYRAFDENIAAYGTFTQTLEQAQAQIMKKSTGSVFMCNGSWYMNEMMLGYKNSIGDITFMNFPVISALADKLWADTVTDEAKREEMLRYAIDQVDDLTKADNPAAIALDMTTRFETTVDEADVIEVRRARNVYSNRTADHQIVLTKGAPANKKAVSELFIRFLASDDAAELIAKEANGPTAYVKDATATEYPFAKGVVNVLSAKYASFCSAEARGYRYVLNQTNSFLSVGHLTAHIAGQMGKSSIYDGNSGLSGNPTSIYANYAKELQTKETQYYKSQLGTWRSQNSWNINAYKEVLQK